MSIPRDAAIDYAEVVDRGVPRVGPIHPGVLLKEEFVEPLVISAYAHAKAISVRRNRITEILRGERAITADTALRLGRFFGMSAEFRQARLTPRLRALKARYGPAGGAGLPERVERSPGPGRRRAPCR